MSGGRSTVALKGGDKLGAQAGDISSVHRLGHAFIDQFVVECKFYKSLNYDSLIRGKGKLLDFWDRTRADSKKYGKKPLLIAKQNLFPTVVCLDRAGMRTLRITNEKMRINEFNLYIMLYEDFLEINPTVMRRVRL